MSSLNIKYEFTWCDFLTQCKFKNCMIGDYDCSMCKYYISTKILKTPSSYFDIGIGIINCNCSKNE